MESTWVEETGIKIEIELFHVFQTPNKMLHKVQMTADMGVATHS